MSSAPATYTVVEADYLDEEEGILKDATVVAVGDPDNAKLLSVIKVGDKDLDEPVSVFATQLRKAS